MPEAVPFDEMIILPAPQTTTDVHYKLMRMLSASPYASQREMARELGISLGKVNYCLRALVKRGWVELASGTDGRNRTVHSYLLTPRGVDEKANMAAEFLRQKLQQYVTLRAEIRQIREEARRCKAAAAAGR